MLKIPCSAATTTVLSGQIFSHVLTAKILRISNKTILLATLHLLSVYLDGTISGALFVGLAYLKINQESSVSNFWNFK